MEDRRACFNEPATTTIKDSDSSKKLMVAKIENRRKKLTVVDSIQGETSDKQQRPARKRKCSGRYDDWQREHIHKQSKDCVYILENILEFDMFLMKLYKLSTLGVLPDL
ncbi:hypothetical protein Tco_1304922 [Tanacetum coccineum]